MPPTMPAAAIAGGGVVGPSFVAYLGVEAGREMVEELVAAGERRRAGGTGVDDQAHAAASGASTTNREQLFQAEAQALSPALSAIARGRLDRSRRRAAAVSKAARKHSSLFSKCS